MNKHVEHNVNIWLKRLGISPTHAEHWGLCNLAEFVGGQSRIGVLVAIAEHLTFKPVGQHNTSLIAGALAYKVIYQNYPLNSDALFGLIKGQMIPAPTAHLVSGSEIYLKSADLTPAEIDYVIDFVKRCYMARLAHLNSKGK